MAVAKSYQELEIVGDVFVSSGRQYVNVKLKSGKLKTVRWYSDAEYRKMYPEAAAVDHSINPYYKPQKEVLGFTKGYITIFKGDTYSEIDWFRASIARYTRWDRAMHRGVQTSRRHNTHCLPYSRHAKW